MVQLQKQALDLQTHHQAFKRSPWWVANNNNKKKDLSSVSMVTEQSGVTRSFSLISQDCFFKKNKEIMIEMKKKKNKAKLVLAL